MMNNPKNRTIGLLREPSDESEQPLQKIYPFYIKFTEGRTKSLWQPVTNNHPNSFQSTQPFITDPEISEMYKDDSFQSYHTSQNPLKVEEQLSQSHLSEQKQQQQAQEENLANHLPILYDQAADDDQYSRLSESHLRAMNYRMVRRKQQLRKMIVSMRKNCYILSQQDLQLQRLKALRQKALDINYQFQLEQASSRKKSQSHLVQQSIEGMSNILKKQRYQRLRDFHQSKDPNDNSRLPCNSRVSEVSQHIPQMLCRREEMLCKRRREEKYASVLEVLTRKKAELQQINCIFDSRICMGDEYSLQKRKKELQELIEHRHKEQISQQQKLKQQVAALKNQLQALQLKIIMAEVQVRKDVDQQPHRSNYLSKVKRKVRCNNSEFSRRIQSIYCVSPKSILSPKLKPSIKAASKQSMLGVSPLVPRKSTYRLISQQVSQRQHTTN